MHTTVYANHCEQSNTFRQLHLSMRFLVPYTNDMGLVFLSTVKVYLKTVIYKYMSAPTVVILRMLASVNHVFYSYSTKSIRKTN